MGCIHSISRLRTKATVHNFWPTLTTRMVFIRKIASGSKRAITYTNTSHSGRTHMRQTMCECAICSPWFSFFLLLLFSQSLSLSLTKKHSALDSQYVFFFVSFFIFSLQSIDCCMMINALIFYSHDYGERTYNNVDNIELSYRIDEYIQSYIHYVWVWYIYRLVRLFIRLFGFFLCLFVLISRTYVAIDKLLTLRQFCGCFFLWPHPPNVCIHSNLITYYDLNFTILRSDKIDINVVCCGRCHCGHIGMTYNYHPFYP